MSTIARYDGIAKEPDPAEVDWVSTGQGTGQTKERATYRVTGPFGVLLIPLIPDNPGKLLLEYPPNGGAVSLPPELFHRFPHKGREG